MRHPKPDFLVKWEEWMKAGPPKTCWTCDHYGGNGQCFTFNMNPPPDFVAQQDVCPCWEREIPF